MTPLEQVKAAAEKIIGRRPAYRDILNFYSRVFAVQEQSLENSHLPPLPMDPDRGKTRRGKKWPLIDFSEFGIDPAAATRTLEEICELALAFAPGLASPARSLKTALTKRAVDPEALFSAILNRDDSALGDLSRRLAVPEPELGLFGYLCIAPGIRARARQLEIHLADTPQRQVGDCPTDCPTDCPICGSWPDLAFLDRDGRRHLHCSFCGHRWRVNRMGCVFCGNNEPGLHPYFYHDEELEYRVNLCDHCGRFIKLVDLRRLDRPFIPRLEVIATLHLDLQAIEKGYRSVFPFSLRDIGGCGAIAAGGNGLVQHLSDDPGHFG